ncbi:MAG: murein biosynthesis integral membrane protein MurJ [Holosporaceae bacterium]|jgi:putative peptidoglycan lipid II flippase|nr:murein biosynthesis integral membrane protein MurJ [Holosporaceae bacterium]
MEVIKNALTVGVFTLFSRLIGFLRECVMAFCLGANVYSDALLVALRVANTFRRIFAEGAFNASFLPRFSKLLNQKGKNDVHVDLSNVFSALLIFLIPFTIVVILFFPSFLKLLVSGFDVLSENFKLTVVLGRICFPYLIFISLASFFCSVLNVINKFALPAAVYSLLSIFTMFGLLIGYSMNLSHYITVHIVAWFVLLSGIAQSYCLFVSVKSHGFDIMFRFHCWTDQVKDVMKNMIPGIIGAGVWHLNLLIDTTISSYLPTGTITCVNLADRLNQFPLGTLGIALSTALLPLLSRFIHSGDYAKAMIEIERGLLFSFFLTFFATSVLMALDEPSVSVAFQRGMFEAEQVRITASAVTGFAVGLPAYILTKVFSTLYFAAGDTKSPVIFGMFSVGLNVIFLFLLVPFLKYFGITVCTSLSALSNAIILIYFSHRKMPLKFTKAFWYKILSQTTAALATYFSLLKLSDLYWSPSLGMKSIKWLVYFGFIGCAVLIFSITTAAGLYLMKQKQWKLWKKESW